MMSVLAEGKAFDLAAETPGDQFEIEALLDRAFGPGRFAKTAYRLREGVAPLMDLGLVARNYQGQSGGQIVGSIRYWPILAGDDQRPALLLGPLAVDPALQGKGVGLALMQQSLQLAKEAGHKIVVLIGDEGYYARVGFQAAFGAGLRFPGPVDQSRLLACALQDGACDGLAGPVTKPV